MHHDNPEDFDFFELDANKLDEEWLKQPKLYFEHATRLVKLRGDYEQSKAAKEVLIAELDQRIRQDSKAYGLEKITEASIEKTILIQKKYVRANEEVLRAKHKMDFMQAVVDTLNHRKDALEALVKLWLANYFAEPRARGNDKEQLDTMKKQLLRNKGRSHE